MSGFISSYCKEYAKNTRQIFIWKWATEICPYKRLTIRSQLEVNPNARMVIKTQIDKKGYSKAGAR